MFELKSAHNDEEKSEIYKFRYKVGIEKYGLKQRYANHQEKTVSEPLDNMADLYQCLCDGVLIGTTRTNYAANNNIDFYIDLYGIHEELNRDSSQVVIGSKLLVDKINENKFILCTYKLLCYQYESVIRNGMKFAYVDCEHRSKLNQFYSKLGFQLHKSEALHPDTGIVNVYRLEMDNIKHLMNVASPFRKIHQKVNNKGDK